MRTSHGIATLALAGLAVGAAVRADGAGRVSDVVASPSPATVGQKVVVVVKGSGNCQATLDFGDGPPAAKITSLPATLPPHVYASGKTYVLRVYSYRDGTQAPGLSPCAGTADTSLVVHPRAGSAVRAPAARGAAAPAPAQDSGLMTYQKIDAQPVTSKKTAQDNWSTTPVPTPTKAAN